MYNTLRLEVVRAVGLLSRKTEPMPDATINPLALYLRLSSLSLISTYELFVFRCSARMIYTLLIRQSIGFDSTTAFVGDLNSLAPRFNFVAEVDGKSWYFIPANTTKSLIRKRI